MSAHLPMGQQFRGATATHHGALLIREVDADSAARLGVWHFAVI